MPLTLATTYTQSLIGPATEWPQEYLVADGVMAVLPPLIAYLLPGCFYHHRQEERSTPILVIDRIPRNQGQP